MSHQLSRLMLALSVSACLPSLQGLQAGERIRIEPGTKLSVRLERSVGTKDFYEWHSFGEVRTVPGTLVQDVVSTDGELALAAGTHVSVAVLESQRAGRVKGRSRLRLGLYSLDTADGEIIPVEGYPTDINGRQVDHENTAHGKRGLVKDAAVDFGSVTVGAGAGFVAAGPFGAAVGAGGGLLVAAIWTVARRGPSLVVPAGTVVNFVIGRPVSVVASGEIVKDGAQLQPETWGRGVTIPPSDDLLTLADQLDSNPDAVRQDLRSIRFKDRPEVDRIFGKYLEAVARFKEGDKDSLKLMREAYREGQASALPEGARAEMARNLVVMLRATDPDWERDPVLNDPLVQGALVEGVQQ
ncbi:MAG TPA: hypothetical protein VKM93_12975 [Terriglobia bacterium]|nr:hypothetical protein [Terriglobia bacterium]